jgi:exoribonuclease R
MIAGILHLNSKTKYGLTGKNIPMYLFRPFDPKEHVYIVGCSQRDTSTNLLALIEPLDMTQRIPRGNLVQILGPCGDWAAEREAIHWTHRPHRQPKVDLTDLEPPENDDRLDLRGFPTFNIDPPGCRDVDDCITIGYEDSIVVTIADVGGWVANNPDLGVFVKNGQTLYDDGRAVRPMFPPELSENLFSLLPNQDRFGISVIFHKDQPMEWRLSIVRVTQSYTYGEADYHPEIKREIEKVCSVTLNDDSHTWVETLMIAYNTFMADVLVKMEQGILRAHTGPNRELLDRYKVICPDATRLAESSAVYSHAAIGETHWGMGFVAYTHMTSPIRRWADTYNQLVLHSVSYTLDLEALNRCGKAAKKHDRDLFFLDQLRRPRPVMGTVLDVLGEKSKVWVSDWKRSITVRSTEYEPGTHLRIEYYLDMNQPTWKKRMVIHASTDCLAPQSLEQAAP